MFVKILLFDFSLKNKKNLKEKKMKKINNNFNSPEDPEVKKQWDKWMMKIQDEVRLLSSDEKKQISDGTSVLTY